MGGYYASTGYLEKVPMLLMADFNAIEWRSPAAPPAVCDFGIEGVGVEDDGGGCVVASAVEVLWCWGFEDIGDFLSFSR
jgi:hypothetical protein